MTSNIGARQLADFGTGVGFGTKAQEDQKEEHQNTVVQNALRKAFSPEFLNRIDDIIMFKSLGRDSIHKIIDIEMDLLIKRIVDLGYSVTVTDAAKDFIVDKGYDAKFGARPLKRAIQKFIEDPLAEQIVKSNLKEGDTINIDYEKDATELSIGIDKGKRKKAEPKSE